ncbi:MAG: hypothetical protein HOZ81_42355, partial [Streptomyces sp.]|nr:hypothetical protein [Streptomyces sp.]
MSDDHDGRREPLGWPDTPGTANTPYKQEPKQSHAGNGTVNHGPDDQGPDGLDSDELALRRML